MDNAIYAVVVIYNNSCEQSKTCRSLIFIDGLRVLVMDNSTSDYGNAEYCHRQGISYHSMNGNLGLSKAYNCALDVLIGEDGIVVWFDDDTEVPADYFEELSRKLQEHPDIQIFVPKIYDERALLSPCRIKGYHVSRLAAFENADKHHLTAINTGMACRLSIFADYRYDERYFLDYIDHAFLRDMKDKGHTIFVLNTKLIQRFSDNTHDNKVADKVRFKIFASDFAHFCCKDSTGRCFYYYTMLARGIKLSIMHRSLVFLGIALLSFRFAFRND